MRHGLTEADLRQFLNREETALFAKDAGDAFQHANRSQDADRLRTLLQP